MEKITHLISMVEFVKHTQNQKQELGQDFDSFKLSQLGVVFRYANFLSQTLELCQFVPCDEEGNFLEEPKYYDEWVAYTNQGWEPEYDAKIIEKYNKAKQRCLFEGLSKMQINWFMQSYSKVEDLSNVVNTLTPVKLTETALNQIY